MIKKKLALGLIPFFISFGNIAFADGVPLLQDGKQTIYQRVLTTPECNLYNQPDSENGEKVPAFSRYYVYENDNNWLKVGSGSNGTIDGFLPKDCTVEWKMQLSLAFTNPANRDRLVFFKDKQDVEDILDAPDPVAEFIPIKNKLDKNEHVANVLAREPEYFVDIKKEFYLLPILESEEVMTDAGYWARILKVASVSENSVDNASTKDQQGQLKEFNAAVMFVIDSTISMDKYIDRTKAAVNKIYEKIESEDLTDQVKFGLVSYRNSIEATPKVEYLTRTYVRPDDVKDGADFLDKVKELRQSPASTASWNEDTYAGIMEAIKDVDWNNYGARYIILITDSGALEADDSLSSTKLNAAQVREEARKRGIAVYTLHLKTPEGKHDHAKAESQYSDLSLFSATGSSLYYSVDAGNVDKFGQMIDKLADAITNQVKSAYMGEDSVGGANYADDDYLMQEAEIIGNAMKLTYLGSVSSTKAPSVFEAWISDRDLIKQQTATTDVRVLLTKAQLSDLHDILGQVVNAANEGLIAPTEMFSQLRSVAATMGSDPNQVFDDQGTKLVEMGLMGEYLEDLPYQSEVLSLDEDTWVNWNGFEQEKFIQNLNTKLRYYKIYNEDVDSWVSLAPNSDPSEYVYPIPLEMMP